MDASGPDFLRHGFGERQDDVQIVNHQVEHDVHVEAARAELAHAVDFEEKRGGHDLGQGHDGRVKAFQVTDLQDASGTFGGFDQLPTGGFVVSYRVFRLEHRSPVSIERQPNSAWVMVGVAMTAASEAAATSSRVENTAHPRSEAAAAALAASASRMPES